MPGIAGIISNRSCEQYEHLVLAMIDCMRYEPFYTSGVRFVPDIGVYAGWVAHEESFAARQSAYDTRHGATLLFSGECFAPWELSGRPGYAAHRSGHDDMGVLPRLYVEEGDSFVGHLNGLFSGLLIDVQKKHALLFNDRYGIERIYYYEQDKAIFFSSEAKALLCILPELRAFDERGVAQFLAFGCTLGERTLFDGMKLLPGGSVWTFYAGGDNRRDRYFRPEQWESQPSLTDEAYYLEFKETFRRILPRYISSSLPIGIALTGGIDTRMITACLSREWGAPVCYTFSGLTEETLDVRLAARVAKLCGLDHHVLRIATDFLENYLNYVDRTVFKTDGCAGALSAHEVYFNSQARLLSTIRLTGNFGSEVLRCVSTFKPLNLESELIDRDFKGVLDRTLQEVSNEKTHPVTFAAFQEIPFKLFGTLAAGRTQLTFRTPYLDNEIVALAFQASARSRRSPHVGLRFVSEMNPELGRIPTDRGLLLGRRDLSSLIKRLFFEVTFKLDYLDTEGLPSWLQRLDPAIGSLSRVGLLGQHKFLPYRRWFRRDLASYISDVLNQPHVQQAPYWSSRGLSSILAGHLSGRNNYIREINAVMTLEAVDRLLVRSFSANARGRDESCE